MYIFNFRNKLHLYRRKIILFIFCILFGIKVGIAQEKGAIFNPNYDDRRLITYGFSIGLHASSYQVHHSDEFGNLLDTLHSITPTKNPGFSLGFIVNLRTTNLLDLRLMPRVSFYEYEVDYNFTNNTTQDVLIENTMVEFPIMLKFKSERRRNFRAYVTGGFAPGLDASGKNDLEDPSRGLNVNDVNLSFEAGIGFDIYYPLFKFSPEIRYSRGVLDILGSERNQFSAGMDRINTNNIHVFFLFQ